MFIISSQNVRKGEAINENDDRIAYYPIVVSYLAEPVGIQTSIQISRSVHYVEDKCFQAMDQVNNVSVSPL